MIRNSHMLGLKSESWPNAFQNQHKQIVTKTMLMIIMLLAIIPSARANVSCKGRFINPISDICWSCILPISIGPAKFGGGMAPSKRDSKNPSSPICACSKGGQPVPIPGISLGFWEPSRMVDITRTKYCMVGLGGLALGKGDILGSGTYNRSYGKRSAHNSYYHVHYYIYPLIYWLELLTDLICLEQGTFDVAYLTELDPTWGDEKLQTLINPEAFIFGNPLAQAACVLDCAAASLDMPRDELFWCSGCWGNMYPWGGSNADHVGGVQNSSLLTTRMIAKMHRSGLAKQTSTTDASINGKICGKQTALKIKKSQYKLQMVYPQSSSGSIGCWPLGMSDMLYSPGREYPYDGQDWSYIIWRKVNCCAF